MIFSSSFWFGNGNKPPIEFVGSDTGSNSVTIPAHQLDDMIIIAALRTSTTPITIPAGWTVIENTAVNGRLITAYKIATSSSEVSGTWSNALRVNASVYRNAKNIGNSATLTDNGGVYNYPAINVTTPRSWLVGHLYADSTTANPGGLTGFTQRDERIGSPMAFSIDDTNGVSGNYAGGSRSTGVAAHNYITHLIEIY